MKKQVIIDQIKALKKANANALVYIQRDGHGCYEEAHILFDNILHSLDEIPGETYERAPEEYAPIIRCPDCIYSNENNTICRHEAGCIYTSADAFCHFAERRES